MARTVIDKNTELKKKNYYSWLQGSGSEFDIADKLSNLAFSVGTPTELVGTERQTIILRDGSANAAVKIIASGFHNAQAAESASFFSPLALYVNGVDAKTVYGGAVMVAKEGSTTVNNKRTTTEAVVNGGSKLLINSANVNTIYGGGAGYGSILNAGSNGLAVGMTIRGTNKINAIYGGGETGAVVNGDVEIYISSSDSQDGGKIGAIYGGGKNAVVNGDVNITIDGVNAVKIGSISGSGNGNKARVNGTRTLTLQDFSGKFTTTIKNFDVIRFAGTTSVTLTAAQNNSIKGATYEFVIDERTVSETGTMLTWNKNVDTNGFYITIDSDFAASADDAFTKSIYSSTQLTEAAFNKASWKVYDENGKEITSGYTLSFVADVDNKGNAKKKGGTVVLSYNGTKSSLTVDSDDLELTDANDVVQIKGDLVRASVDTKGGDDRVTVQTNTLMAGDIYLGEGKNVLNVQGDAEVTGSIVVSKNSTNTINVNGTISQIEGGDETTYNHVTLRSPNAVGYYKNTLNPDDRDALGDKQEFIAQDLDFSGYSNDEVAILTAGTYTGNINLCYGDDTIILDTTVAGTITSWDGGDVIVANKTGATIDANTLKLAGTDNVLVLANGVQADITGFAIGDFGKADKTFGQGIYLGQNAIATVNGGDAMVSSFNGVLDLTAANGVGAKNLTILPLADGFDRISTWYTKGTGVNGDIYSDGQKIRFEEGAVMNGTIHGAANLRFAGTAGGNIYFDNEAGEKSTLYVDKDAVATVGSIEGLGGNTYKWADFDADLAQVTWAGVDAAVYEADTKNLIVGITTKEITDFAAAYGVDEVKQITVDGIFGKAVTFKDATVYTAEKASYKDGTTDAIGFADDVNFVGANTINVKTNGLVLSAAQMNFATGATANFNVLRDGLLVFDGILLGGTYDENITVTYENNARFAYGDTMKTKNWDGTFTADELYATNTNNKTQDMIRNKVEFVEGAVLQGGIDLTKGNKAANLPGVEITIADNVGVKGINGHEDEGAIRLGAGADTLTVGKAIITGIIDANDDAGATADTINLNGTVVSALSAPAIAGNEAIVLDNQDVLHAENNTVINGDVKGGKHVHVADSTITGSVNATTNILFNSKVGKIAGGDTFVESGNTTEKLTSEIGAIDLTDADVALYADGSIAKIGEVHGLKDGEYYNADAAATRGEAYKTLTVEARNGATVEFAAGIEAVVGGQWKSKDKSGEVVTKSNTTSIAAIHEGSEVKFNGDLDLVTKGNVELRAQAGGELTGLGDVTITGGVNETTDPLAANDKALKNLEVNLEAANKVVIMSEVTDLLGSDEEAVKKTVSNLTAGDVGLVAKESYLIMRSEGSVNTFGDIEQVGGVTQYGYPLNGTDVVQRGSAIDAADKAVVDVVKGTFKADSITQIAKTADVAFIGTAEVTDGIVQGMENEPGYKFGDVENAQVVLGAAYDKDLLPTPGYVKDTKNGSTVLKSSISQYATKSATVDAEVQVVQKYTNEAADVELDDIEFTKLSSVISGAIKQETTAGDNTFKGGVNVEADGSYATVNGDKMKNPVLHKRAVVTADSVEATYGNVTQTGQKNTVDVGISYTANGESDVTVKGASTLTLGKIVQNSEKAAGGSTTETVNTVEVTLAAVAGADDKKVTAATQGAQSKLTLGGDVTANIGSITQVAYNNNNELTLNTRRYSEKASAEAELAAKKITAEDMAGKAYGEIVGDAKVAMTVDGNITMLAVYGENTLKLNAETAAGADAPTDDTFFGTITINGNINVGGVLTVDEAKKMTGTEYAQWGDRVAKKNTVTADAGTVTVNGDLSMIALTNELTINNSSTTEKSLAQNIYVAGNNNKLTVGTGVKTDNIHFYELKDYDKFGQEEYEIGLKDYENTLTVKGTVTEVIVEAENSKDTINVFGGKVVKDVVTKNGDDTITLGNDGTEVEGDSTIGGNVVMGIKDAAKGNNTLTLSTFTVGTGKDAKDYNSTIVGNVAMYADADSENEINLFSATTSVDDAVTEAFVSTGDIAQVGGYNVIDNNTNSSYDLKIKLGNVSQDSESGNEFDLTRMAGTVDAVSQKVEVADELDDKGKIKTVKEGDNFADIGGVDFGGIAMKGISQEADGQNDLWIDGEVHQIGTGTEEDPYQDELSVNRSSVTGDISQKSTRALDKTMFATMTKLSDLATDNEIGLSVTDVTGNISQTSNNRNKATIAGDVITTHYIDGNGVDQTYDQVVSMKVDGSITQEGGLNNSLDVDDASITGKVTQSSSIRNKASFSSTATDVAINNGKVSVDPEDDKCEYEGAAGHNDGVSHVSDTVKVKGSYNTQTVGDVDQTITLPTDEDVLKTVKEKNLKAYNMVDADNTNVGNINQVNAYGSLDAAKATNLISNRIEVDGGEYVAGKEYVAEIDESAAHASVTKVKTFTASNSVTVGNIDQTGINNDAILNDVSSVGTVKQTAFDGKGADGNDYLANNMLHVTAAEDHVKYIVDVASWEGDALTGKEVFTKTVLAGTENKRTVATIASIEQLNAATGNYEKETMNTVTLTNADVTGDVVQKATAEKVGNVVNSFTATTTKEHFTDLYVTAGGEIAEITGGYDRAELNEISGSFTQSGFVNAATLTGTSVKGAVSQTAGIISDYDKHAVVTAQKVGSNTFLATGLAKDDEVLVKKADKLENEKLEAKDNIVEVGSITQTIDATMADKYMAEKTSITVGNDLSLNLANAGAVVQNATANVDNVFVATNSTIVSYTATNTQTTWKVADVEHKTTGYTVVTLADSTVTNAVTTGSGNDVITIQGLTGSKVGSGIATGAGNDTINLLGKTTVTGTIDMGEVTGDNDVLNVKSADVDLTAASIKGAEKVDFTASSKTEWVLNSIEADSVVATGGTTLKAKVADLGSTTTNLAATSATSAVDFKIDYMAGANISGAKDSAADKLSVGVPGLNTVTVSDIENVTFETDANLSNVTWKDTTAAAANSKIAFTGTGMTTAADGKTFVIGAFDGYLATDISFDGFVYNTNLSAYVSAADKDKTTLDDLTNKHYIKYSGSNGTLTAYTHTVAP